VSVTASGVASVNGQASVYTSHKGYDAQGDLTSASTPPITTTLNGTTTTAPVTTSESYDGDGNRTAATAANRASTLYNYDHLGRQAQTTEPAVALYNAPLIVTPTVALNSGGGTTGAFSADAFYSGGGTYSTGAAIDTSGVISAAPQAVYQSERYGALSYVIPGLTAGAAYRVRLHFAEIFFSAPGQRVFNVAINGSPVLSAFDIVTAAGGPNRALVEEFIANADSGGHLTVQFTNVVDNAKVSGIEIIPTTARRETTGYDGEGNAVRTTDALGAVTTSSYDPLGRQVSTTNPVSGTTITTYNATEQIATQDPQGNTTTDQYDAAGRLIQATDALTGTVQYGYDAAGNTTAITTGDTSGSVIQVETQQYDALNRAITDTVAGPNGASPQTTTTRYDPDGNVYQINQPNGTTTVDTYDLADDLVTSETDGAPVLTPTHQNQSVYRYDAAGNQVETVDPDGRDTVTTLDGDNRAVGEVSTTPSVTGTTTMTTTTGDDPDGNTLAQTVQTRDPAGNVQTFTGTSTYNAADWTTSTTDNGVTTSYGYDAAGQQRTQTYQNGAATATMTLDAEGRLTALGDGAGHTSSFGYNANDQTTAITLPNGVSEQASYDANGRLTAWHDPGPGQNVTYAYGHDAASRVTSFTAVSGTDTLTYNPQNRLASDCGPQVVAQSTDHCYHWTYDGTGNISTTTVDAGSPVTYTYTYNPQTNELTTLYAPAYANNMTYYGYDGSGNTTAITSPVGGSLTAPGAINTHLGYNAAGRISSVTLKDGRTIAIMYNAAGQRASYSALSATRQTLYSAQFSYSGGALSQASVVSATAGGGTMSYTDSYLDGGDGRPIEFTRVQNGTTNYYWYEYDGRGDVVSVTDSTGNVVDSYEYDQWGEELTDTTHETVPQRLRAGAMWYDAEMQVQWLWDGGTNRYYDPDLVLQREVRRSRIKEMERAG